MCTVHGGVSLLIMLLQVAPMRPSCVTVLYACNMLCTVRKTSL